MDLRKKIEKNLFEINKENEGISLKRASLKKQIKKVAQLRDEAIDEVVYEILASLELNKEEDLFLKLYTDHRGLTILKDLLLRSNYIPPISGEVAKKETRVSVSKARIRVVFEIKNIKIFLKNLNSKLNYFELKISLVGETTNRFYFIITLPA